MSGATGIDTSQLVPLQLAETGPRRAAMTCAVKIVEEGGTHEQLLELLRALGLAHDPYAKDRDPMLEQPRSARLRGPQ